MTGHITTPALTALSDLVHTARSRGRLDIAHTLDGARTRLVQDGSDYLDAAWAFIDAARRMLADADADADAVARVQGVRS